MSAPAYKKKKALRYLLPLIGERERLGLEVQAYEYCTWSFLSFLKNGLIISPLACVRFEMTNNQDHLYYSKRHIKKSIMEFGLKVLSIELRMNIESSPPQTLRDKAAAKGIFECPWWKVATLLISSAKWTPQIS